ncbi:hypothetical protein D3C76_1227320 [compost metagenome]
MTRPLIPRLLTTRSILILTLTCRFFRIPSLLRCRCFLIRLSRISWLIRLILLRRSIFILLTRIFLFTCIFILFARIFIRLTRICLRLILLPRSAAGATSVSSNTGFLLSSAYSAFGTSHNGYPCHGCTHFVSADLFDEISDKFILHSSLHSIFYG